jgi:iron complex outermembrane receptor protein
MVLALLGGPGEAAALEAKEAEVSSEEVVVSSEDEAAAGEPAAGFSDEVTVTGTREERAVDEVPTAIGVVSRERLQEGKAEGLDAYLNQIPGVVTGTNDGGSDVKLSIRGFGARSTFGVRDILVLVDGIPITDADGFTRLDQIDLAAAERVEVVKGPASALYGNAAFGGVVNVITRHGDLTSPEVGLRAESGSFGFSKLGLSAGGGLTSRNLAYGLHLSRFDLTGFRDHNETETRRFNGTVDWFPDDRTTVRFLGNLSQMRDEIPGTLSRQQMLEDPSQVRPFFELFDWRRDDDRYRLGAVVERQLGASGDLEGRLFVLTRDLDHPIFQVIDQDGLRFMGGLRWSRQTEALGADHRFTVGADVDREDIDNRRFRNVFGGRGELLVSADERVESSAVFAQDEIALSPRLSLTVGGRFDRIRFVEDDRLQRNGDLSDRRTFSRFSPKLGLLWQKGLSFGLYVNLATAFQTPTKSELTSTVGDEGINQDLEPQLARHAEVGARGVIQGKVRYELSVFRTEVEDEILPLTQVQNVTIFGNVGETRHDGVEMLVDLHLHRHLELGLTYGWSDNTFTGAGELVGNALPGHPDHRGTLRLSTRQLGAFSASLVFERVGTIYLDDDNSETQSPYSLLHASLAYEWRRLSLFVHGSNLTDELHAAWLAVNDPAGNFFAPAPGRSLSGGVEIRF